MKINQIAETLNEVINNEQIGVTGVIQEDLSNLVDIGKEVLDYVSNKNNFDSFMNSLIDQVGRVMFVDRVYRSQAPNILKDSWEYGSILMKVRAELPEAWDNTSWALGSIANGTGLATDDGTASPLDPFVLNKPDVTAKFYNKKTTFEVPITLAEVQLKEAFRSAAEMGRFIAMIENRIQTKMTLCTDGLVMRTIINLIGQKVNGGNNVVNLLKEYNTIKGGTALTVDQALIDGDFLRYAAKTIMLYKKYLASASTLYNEDGYVTFTPENRLKVVVLSEFAKDMETYVYADTYHRELVTLEGYEEVPYWQGTGDQASDGFSERAKIDVKIETSLGSTADVKQEAIVAVMFDDEAAAVNNENYRVTSIYNPRGEYTNFFYKWDANYMNDTAENVVVFTLADATV